jgi:predicted ATPase/DNA-binding SARP family transcriptional activator
LLRLKTFGGLSLESDGGTLGGAAAQRRRLGVLAVLAASGSRGLTRDKLIGLLWPEVDESRARSALSQALYTLRRDTGVADLVVGYDRLTLNELAITSDVAELEAALAHGDRAHAASVYAGPFLDGVHLDGAPEFEHWLDATRLRFDQAAERAITHLARESGERQDHAAAAAWWRRLTEIDPLRTSAVMGLMESLVARGDRAGALRHAERYEQRAREELGEASADVMELARSLRGEREAQRVADRFVMERELGRNERAVAHVARDTKHDRQVVVTVLRAPRDADVSLEQLAHEIRGAARLQHPHILPLLEFGEWGDDVFHVTPFVDGESLRARLKRDGRLALSDAVTIAQEIAGALDHAHRHGIVHGDVKPEHVVLVDGHALVMNFGMRAAANRPPSPRTTDSVREDVARLGCMLYEMLAGRAPCSGTGARSSAAPPLRTLRPDTPPWLDELVRLMLASDASRRVGTAGEIARALANGASAPPSSIPATGDSMIGRDAELAAACALLERTDVSLVTLTGPGGVGKTRLAIQVARAREPQCDRVYFVDLSPVRDPSGVIPAIAAAIGLPLQSDRNAHDALAAAFDGRRTLLVLDNFEQIASAAPTLSRLSADAPTLELLVTSRVRLGIPAEHELHVSPLAVPDIGAPVDAIRKSAAVQLFVRRASDASAAIVFDDEAIGAAARICARLDGLPLAIELAAARCRLMSPRSVARRLDAGLGLLSGGRRHTPERHQTMRHAVAWSYALLRPEEQRLFVRMAVFAGGCTLAAAEAVCGDAELGIDVIDGVSALVDASSLVRDRPGHDGEPRLRMLATVREFALESLAGDSDADSIARRHADWYRRLAESHAPRLTGEAQHGALTALADEHANLAAALEYLLDAGDAEASLAMGAALWRYWLVRGYLAEGRAWLARILALPVATSASAGALRADVMTGAGHIAQNTGAVAEASRYFEAVLTVRRQLNDRTGVASALADLGWVRWRQCDYPESRRLSAECLAVAETLGATRVVALALTNLGATALCEGQFDEARAAFARSAELRARVADRRGVAFANMLLGWTLCRAGALDAARVLLEEAEDTLRAIGDRRLIYFARDVQAEVFLRAGDAARAAAILDIDSIAGVRRFGDRYSVAHGLASASWASRLLGDLPRAVSFAEESLELRRAEGDRYGEAECLALLAAAARAAGDEPHATELLQSSRAIRLAIGDAAGVAECDAELAPAGAPA